MSQALGSGSDRDAVLTRFVSGLSGRDARLLRRLLAEGNDRSAAGGRFAGDDPGSPAGDLDRGTGRG
jgi:hypothetical protein